MPLDHARARQRLHDCQLETLFIEDLGWDTDRRTLILRVGDADYPFAAIATKRGVTAWLCVSPNAAIPDHPTRLKLDRKLSETSFEHLIVFVSADRSHQSWMWVRREPGKPLAARTHDFHRGQTGEALLQKLNRLFISLEEDEAGLSIVEVAGRARAAFDIERVTKAFYRDFDAQRKAFLQFIEGIDAVADREWYASVMLNRLMFVYFIQRKGFLDADPDYLRNRLARCQRERGKDQFYGFYRQFLLRLFHEGLGKRPKDRSPGLESLLGNIPYLNGGLFDVHDLERPERYGPHIQIADEAFAKVFAYFDQYQWHLDERPLRADNEINPDVLGYIFEKYINQKQMGAYYTKEDITEYISKNTIIPFLLDAARSRCRIAFEQSDPGVPPGTQAQAKSQAGSLSHPPQDGPGVPPVSLPPVWQILAENPDRYIYPAVRHGTHLPLPPDIADGIDTTRPHLIERRKAWNKPAPETHALPTEIWREVVARRQRCDDLRRRLATGEVQAVNDLITLNLDIRKFARDIIDTSEGPDLLWSLWEAITTITVLDPTGGSGAFLFAALNILDPLYEACLERMEAFLDDWGAHGRKFHPNYHKRFTDVLARVSAHPNRRYFVLKSIILNNLYAVDIMEEAVEICKLRLFLKLAAQVAPNPASPNLGIEPLPDIDFNIRAGNTLVGYASKEEVQRCMKEVGGGQMKLLDEDELGSFARFQNRCADVEQAFAKFRQLQTEGDGSIPHHQKAELQARLRALEEELNQHLAAEYGVKPGSKAAYAQWLKSHQPFHWFVHFYGILNAGGFDVIIGNPPYVSATKARKAYTVKNLVTSDCSDIYAWVLERAESFLRDSGRCGMIVPLSLSFSSDFDSCRRLLLRAYGHNWFSSFGRIPAALFAAEVRVRNTNHVGHKTKGTGLAYTTRLHRWFEAARPALLPNLVYAPYQPAPWKYRIPKINTGRLSKAFEAAFAASNHTLELSTSSRATKYLLHFKKSAYNWLNFCRSMPPCYEGSHRVEHTKFGEIYFDDAATSQLALLLANGKLMLAFWFVLGDDFDVTRWNFADFPADLSKLSKSQRDALLAIVPKLEQAMEGAVQFKLNAGRRVGNYNLAKCRHVTDESDAVLAEGLGFKEAWDDIELYYAQTIKTNFSNDDEEPPHP